MKRIHESYGNGYTFETADPKGKRARLELRATRASMMPLYKEIMRGIHLHNERGEAKKLSNYREEDLKNRDSANLRILR